jgi:hypothetical protein
MGPVDKPPAPSFVHFAKYAISSPFAAFFQISQKPIALGHHCDANPLTKIREILWLLKSER